MKRSFTRRIGSAENTANAEHSTKGGNVSKPILPKVFEWTEARREYRRAYTALRMSFRLVQESERLSRKHWHVYDSLCMEFSIHFSYQCQVWRAAGGKR